MRILVVDDDRELQSLMRAVLRDTGARIDCAGDGLAAIEAARRGGYDLVILDLMLPKANGFEVAAALDRLSPKPQVVVLSALADHFGDRFPAGTVMLQKPFELEHLLGVIAELRSRRRDAREESAIRSDRSPAARAIGRWPVAPRP